MLLAKIHRSFRIKKDVLCQHDDVVYLQQLQVYQYHLMHLKNSCAQIRKRQRLFALNENCGNTLQYRCTNKHS